MNIGILYPMVDRDPGIAGAIGAQALTKREMDIQPEAFFLRLFFKMLFQAVFPGIDGEFALFPIGHGGIAGIPWPRYIVLPDKGYRNTGYFFFFDRIHPYKGRGPKTGKE